MAFLSAHRENEGRVLSKRRPSQTSLRSSGGRCHKSHAPSPPDQRMSRLPSLGARDHAPKKPPAIRLCERSISRPSPSERLLVVCTCPRRRCIHFYSQSPFRSEAEPRI